MDDRQTNPTEELLTLTDESGEEMRFRFLDLILFEDREYLVLQPAEGPYRDEAVILRREQGEAGEADYADVSDEKTLRAVYELFRERAKDRFLFLD